MSKHDVTTNKWDLFVRISHWFMVMLVAGCWYTAENGHMQWHYYCGYGLLTIVIGRLIWGIVGSKPARFTSFIKSPKAVVQYLRNIRQNNSGTDSHSPAGGYSVIALFALMLFQTISGLFAVEVDGFDGGPLSETIDYDLSVQISELHQFNFDILLFFIGLHVIAVAFYQIILKQKLLQKMSFFS